MRRQILSGGKLLIRKTVMAPFIFPWSIGATVALLASSPTTRTTTTRHRRFGGDGGSTSSTSIHSRSTGGGGTNGRKRYQPSQQQNPRRRSNGDKSTKHNSNRKEDERMVWPDPPALTSQQPHHQPLPSYFTCRHTYEETLMAELEARYGGRGPLDVDAATSSPFPGVVRWEPPAGTAATSKNHILDPVYALQVLPDCVIVSAESIKGLAQAVVNDLLPKDNDDLQSQLREAPRASLTIHGLVPGMCKGQGKPIAQRRAQKVAEAIQTMLRPAYAAARKPLAATATEDTTDSFGDDNISGDHNGQEQRWLLQVLLLTPEVAAASLTRCQPLGAAAIGATWPNWRLPVGMAQVDIPNSEDSIPSSAYRKLLEAFWCMNMAPAPGSMATDLGASPGGWTAILQRLSCQVTAVDRAELAPNLMKMGNVKFIQGDAFTYVPEYVLLSAEQNQADQSSDSSDVASSWLVSDVIAYPDRIHGLLDRWCGNHWANFVVVTIKFQGGEGQITQMIDDIDKAISICRSHGYQARAKHMFNNKNEVTLMACYGSSSSSDDGNNNSKNQNSRLSEFLIGSNFYPITTQGQS